jgi:histidine triad (HIT) family protein
MYDSACVFCKIAGNQLPADIVFRDVHIVAFRDTHPVAPVHVLIVPVKHIPSLNDLSEAGDEILAGRLLSVARQITLQEQVAESGYRIVINSGVGGGQTVNHLHLHLIGGRRMRWPPG